MSKFLQTDVKPKIQPRTKKEGEFYVREIGHAVAKD
jgi:hypothetical protein